MAARYIEAAANVEPVRHTWALPRAAHALLLFCRRKPLGALGGFLILVMLVMALGAPWIAHYSYDESIPGARMKPPGAHFWMGTDNLSRDVWSRVVYGARVSVTVGFVTIALSTFVAMCVGVSDLGAHFWMGTDNLSRDVWSRVVYGARVSVTVGFVTIALSTFVAMCVGVS